MVPAAATFVLCLAIVLGTYWAFVVLPEDQASKKLRKRLRPDVPQAAPGRPALARRAPPLSTLKGLDAMLGRSGKLIDPLRRLVEQSGLTLTPGGVILASILIFMLVFIVARSATGLNWAATIIAIAMGAAPFLAVRY